MNPEQQVDWMKEFGELARKVASEARKLALVTDDDRHWDEAHKISTSLPLSSVPQVSQQGFPQAPRHGMPHDPRQAMQPNPPQAILQNPSHVPQQNPLQAMQQSPQAMQQDFPQAVPQNHTQDLQQVMQRTQPIPASVFERSLGPLGQKACKLEKKNRVK